MKLTEIMIIKKDDTGNRLKLFQVDDDTLAKLTRIRGSLYEDNPRLKVVKDLPVPEKQKEPECVISPEMKERAEASYRAYKENERKAATMTPEPPNPMTFEEQLAHDWRFTPGIRKEFTSFGSYQAYMRAAESGRCRVYGV